MIESRIGQVVYAQVLNPRENPYAEGKPRPVVLVKRDVVADAWWVMGLTSAPFYRMSGRQRERVPNPRAVGLRGPGYLWGENLTWLPADAIEPEPLGWADLPLAAAICRLAKLPSDEAQVLRDAAKRAHLGQSDPNTAA